GRVVIRAKADIEVEPNGRETIVVSEIPYMVNKKEMLEKIGQMVDEKKIEGITYMNDETSREGVRVIFRVKQGSNSNVVLNTLYKYTPLQSSFAINNVALVGGRPRTMSLKDIIRVFVDFRHDVIVRRTRFELEKARKRAHILEGLIKAIDVIDRIIEIVRSSRSVDEAKGRLIEEFGFSDLQATAIVEMKIRQLTGLEREKLQAEYDELAKFIAYCEDVLASTEKQMEIIKNETMELKAKYGDKRRSEIVPNADEFNPEDFYADDDAVITISHFGYIKRTPLAEYRTQNRGGVGMKGSATRDEDFIEHLYVANMHSTMLFFTESGRCFWLKVYQVPECPRSSKGRAIQNVLSIPDDKIKAIINVPKLNDEEYVNSHYIILATKQGIIKKTSLEAYSRPRLKGVNAVNVREGDELLDAILTDGKSQVLIASRGGRCVRFDEVDARPLGRTATGVRGINLDEGDEAIGMVCYEPENEDASLHTLLVIGEKGLGKRTDFEEYRKTSRGSKGVRTMNITDKTGVLVAMKNVTEDNDLLIITKSGLIIRMAVSDIKQAGRNTQGVKLINIKDNDSIASVSVVARGEEEALPEGEASAEVSGTSDSGNVEDNN
ncbi:MAG: DNA gyrase subunit A, partial [Bacteroidales bacterium]|nr:DNA gyrase subunit A [Bacteroidales bacterium]